MLKLKKLTFCNIGRFIEEQTIDFETLGNLVQVDAQNLNTSGSSGSGKSTIFNALDWLLGLSDFSLSILQSRLTKDHIYVQGEFDWDGKQLLIKRSKKLSIILNGVETTGSSKLTEELLDQILGIPRNLFRPLLHKKQGEQGFFLSFTPSQMNNFLIDSNPEWILIRSKVETIDIRAKELTSTIVKTQSELEACKASLAATEEAITSLGQEPTTNVSEELLEGWKGQRDEAISKLSSIQTRHKAEKEVLETTKPKLVSVPFDRTYLESLENDYKLVTDEINLITNSEKDRQTAINKEISTIKIEVSNKMNALKLENGTEISNINNHISELNNQIKLGKASREAALKIVEQIKVLKSGICHTCEQSWITEKSEAEQVRLIWELSKHKVNIELSSKATATISTLEDTLITTNVHYNALKEALTVEMNEKLKLLVKELHSDTLTQVPKLERKLLEISDLKNKERIKEKEHVANQNAINHKAMESFFMDQKALMAKHDQEMKEINKVVNDNNMAYENCISSLKSYKEALIRFGSSMNVLRAKEWETNQKLVHMNQKLVQEKEQVELLEEIKRCLKSYLSCSFDDALDSISDTATRILRSVPTMANSTVRIEGTKETDKGAIKEQVTATIDNDGELEIPLKSLSGGERSAVDLAIDLAVCEMLQERNNVGIDLLLLDEVMGGFDSTCKEQGLEMLKTFANNRRIFIVEHDSITKELVSDRIVVVREGETSFLK
jgi:energy-coupling factor transporter ATP-binding protein EcfA2